MYETREEFVNTVKEQYPQYRRFTNEEVYQDYTDKYPEYKSRIRENQPVQDQMVNLYDDEPTEETASEKTFFTGLKEIFSKDFYKYVPFVRDAELFETGDLLMAANRVKDGTASEEDILKVKEFSLDRERKTSWGYDTLKLIAHIPAYAVEFGASIATFGGAAVAKGAATTGKMAARSAALKAVEQASASLIGKVAATKGAQAVAKATPKFISKPLATAVDLTGRQNFASSLAKGAQMARTGVLKDYVKEQGVKRTANTVMRKLGSGAIEASALNAFRSPQAINQALQRMAPEFVTEEGLDEDITLRLIDEGDDVIPALVKAYADQGIEFFSESVGDSLYMMHHLMGGEVLKGKAVKALQGAVKKVPGQETVSRALVNMPLKAALAKHMAKLKPGSELRESLKQFGFQGTFAEMYEERVGGALRTAVGLQDNWLPTPEQLASEAVAFTLFGAASTATDISSKSKILGGAGFEAAKRARELNQVDPTSPEAVKLESELDEHVDEHVDLALEQAENPGFLVKAMRSIKIGKFEPFANYEQRGSISEALTMLGSDSVDARIRAGVAEGKSKEEIKTETKEYIKEWVKNLGIREVQTERQRKQFQTMQRKGEVKFVVDNEGRGFYTADLTKIEKRYKTVKGVKGAIDLLKADRGVIYIDNATFEKLNEQGALEGSSINHVLDTTNPEALPSIGDLMNLFNMSSPAEAKKQYEVLQTVVKSVTKANKNARKPIKVTIKMLPAYAVVRTPEEVEASGYAIPEGQEGAEQYISYIGGTTQVDPSNPENITIGLSPFGNSSTTFEELIEGVIKSQALQSQSDPTLEMIYNTVGTAVKAAGIEGYDLIEQISKSYLAAVVGNYKGQDAEKFAQVDFTTDQKDLLNEHFAAALGPQLIQMMVATQEAEAQAETEAEQEAQAEAVDETPTTTTEEVEAEEQQPEEVDAPVTDAPILEQAEDAFIDEDVGRAKSILQAAAERIEALPEGQTKSNAITVLENTRAVFQTNRDQGEQIAYEEALFELTQGLRLYNLSFSQTVLPMAEQSNEDDMLNYHATYNDYLHERRLANDINSSALGKYINDIYGGYVDPLRYLYRVLKEDKDTRSIIEDALQSEERFATFLNEPANSNAIRTLHTALNEMLNKSNRNIDDVHDLMRHMFRRYENLELFPVYQVSEFRSGKQLQLLNKTSNEIKFREDIYKHLSMILRNTDAATLKRNWNLAYRDGGVGLEVMAKNFATVTGLPENLFLSFERGLLAKYYERFGQLLNTQQNNTAQSEVALKLAEFFYSNAQGNAYQKTLLNNLLTFNAITDDLTISYNNTEGNKEMALRSSSQIITARNAIAAEQGVPLQDAMAMLSGARINANRKGSKKLLGQERSEVLFDVFNLSTDGFYYQSAGQQGGKNQIYMFRMKKYETQQELQEQYNEYVEYYNRLAKETDGKSKEFLLDPKAVKALLNQYITTKNPRRLFKLNTIFNKAKIDKHLHGNYSSYKSLRDLVKRSSQIPTPGYAFKGRKKIRFKVVEDANITDGQGIISPAFAKEFAEYMGVEYTNGVNESDSIKPNVRFVAPDGSVKQLKGNLINSAVVANRPGYDKIHELLTAEGNNIDMIIPASVAKLGYTPEGDILELNLEDTTTHEISGEQFLTVQNLNYSTDATVENVAKQQITDTLLGLHGTEVASLANENAEILRDIVGQNFNLLFSRQAQEVAEEIAEAGGEIDKVSEEAARVITKIAKALRPYNRTEATDAQIAAEMLDVVREIINDHAWHKQADTSYFETVFQLLNTGVLETDPQISQVVEQIKADFVIRATRRKMPRVMMQKVAQFEETIPDFQKIGNDVRLPMIVSNTKNVRVAEGGFSTLAAAVRHIKENRDQYIDMFVIKDGKVTNEVREYEIRTPEESAEIGLEEFSIPGGLIVESRIPGENLQSHIAHRLLRPVNADYRGNFSMSPTDVSLRKGEDFDGDIGYQFILHHDSRSKIEDNRNLMLLLMADTYSKAEYLDSVQRSVDPRIFDNLAPDATAAELQAQNIYSNTTEGEGWANEANSTALDALGRVASSIKMFDISEFLQFTLKNDSKLQGRAFGNVRVNYHKGGRADAQQELIKAAERKVAYATAMVNITVDNQSTLQMQKLGLNEITTPIAQALLFLQTDLNLNNLEQKMGQIVQYIKSAPVQAYVEAIRERESLDFNRAEFAQTTREFMLEKLLERRGIKGQNTVQELLLLDELVSEIATIARVIDSQYKKPGNAAELLQVESNWNSLVENKYRLFDTSNADNSVILKNIGRNLQMMKDMAFNRNVLMSELGKQLIDQIPDKHKGNKFYVEHIEDFVLRTLSVRGLYTSKPNYVEELGYLIQQIISYEIENNDNMFLGMLEVDEGNSHRIELQEAFHRKPIPRELRELAARDFAKLPEELQEAFIRHQVLVYGLTNSTYNGGYLSIISEAARRKISKDIDVLVNQFIEGTLPEETVEYIKQNVEPNYRKRGQTVWYTEEKINMDVPPSFLREGVMRQNFDYLERIPPALKNEVVNAEEYKEAVIKARTEMQEAAELYNNPFNYTVRSSNNIGSDSLSYSLLQYHQAVTYISPTMMAGAKGAHKRFQKLVNDADADRVIARLLREKIERSVGARKELGRKARPVSERQRQNGKDLLAAIAAQMTAADTVIIDVVERDLPIDLAVKELLKRYRKRYGEAMDKKDQSAERLKAASRIMKDGTVAQRKLITLQDSMAVIIEAELKDYAAKQKRTTVPISIPIESRRSIDQIIAEYEANKEDWMASAAEILEEMTNAFDSSRENFNKQNTAYLKKIPKRANYLPMLRRADRYKLDLLEQDINTLNNYGGDVRSLSRLSGINTFKDMVDAGYIPLSTNPAELFEKYVKQTSNDRYISSVWQMMLMSSLPDGSQVAIPRFNRDELVANPMVSTEFIEAYAEKLEFSMSQPRQKGETPVDYIDRMIDLRGNDFVELATGQDSMPIIYVRKGQTENVARMIIGARLEGKFWKAWETITSWTKFFAIGVPYLSWFHHTALLESQIAIGGLTKSSAYNPRKHWLDWKKFKDNLANDPEIARKWYQAGMRATLEDPDYQQGVVNRDIESAAEFLQRNKHGSTAKALRKFLVLKKNWDTKLWVEMHAPLKVWTAEGLLHDARMNAERTGEFFDEKRAISEIAELVDQLYGGINFQRRLWATPVALQMANNASFAFDWTFAAAGMAGAGNIPGLNEFFGRPTDYQNEIRYGKYIPAFAAIVMFGIPNAIQSAIWTLTRPVGDDDDQPFTFLNETDRATWIDLTPLYRIMPWYNLKQYGTDTGERRVYMRWGKQGYEIRRWVEEPFRAAGYKLSVPLKLAIEQMTGRSIGGWDLAFKNADYFGVFQAKGSFLNSRVGEIVKAFTPFSVQDIINNKPTPIPFVPVNFAKMKQGKHGWYAAKQLTELYLGYVKKGNFDKLQNHKKNIMVIGSDILQAAARNGYSATSVQKQALANARADLYAKLEDALKKKKIDQANDIAVRLRGLEAMAWQIKRVWQKASQPS